MSNILRRSDNWENLDVGDIVSLGSGGRFTIHGFGSFRRKGDSGHDWFAFTTPACSSMSAYMCYAIKLVEKGYKAMDYEINELLT